MPLITEVTPQNARDGGRGIISGPLADLDASSYDYQTYQYPSATNPDYPDKGHYIYFYINIPEKSYWNTNSLTSVPPVANRNSDASRFGLREETQRTMVGGVVDDALSGLANFVLNNKTVRTTAAVSLYVPNTMVYSQQAVYDAVSLSAALGEAGNLAYGIDSILNGNFGPGVAALGGILSNEAKIALKKVKLTNRNPNDLVGQNMRDVVLGAAGIADNPQNFLLFKQMDFRKFQFDFLLTPESPEEASIINQIIYLFRFHSAPEVLSGTGGRFFVPPSMFDIDVIHNGQRNIFLPRISTCVLNSVTVDYAAAEQWSTHYDGVPQQIRMTLNFTESEIMTKDRIQQDF